jgi:hypothetical protein
MANRSDAPQNMQELEAWNTRHGTILKQWEMEQINRRWRSLGKLAHTPAGLFSVKNYN